MSSASTVPNACFIPCGASALRGAASSSGLDGTRRWTRSSAVYKAIIAEHGAQAILPYSYLGTEGLLNGLNVGDAFFNRLVLD